MVDNSDRLRDNIGEVSILQILPQDNIINIEVATEKTLEIKKEE